jgi:hypothetical protein
MKLPWTQLTHFSYYDVGDKFIALCNLLQLAPNLLEVEWMFSQRDPESKWQPNPSMIVQHSRLRDLSVSMFSNPGSSFDCLSLPSLRKLCITTYQLFRAWSWIPFGFLSRNGQTLESFWLQTEAVKASELFACLKVLPALSDLTLIISRKLADPVDMTELLQSLSFTAARGNPSESILPALSTITIYCDTNDLNVGTWGQVC